MRGGSALRAWLEPDALVDQRWETKEFRVNGDKVLVRQNTGPVGRRAESSWMSIRGPSGRWTTTAS